MATGFVQELQRLVPEGRVDIILKKELSGLAAFLPGVSRVYLFSKSQYPGLKGALAFGRQIAAQRNYDLFFSLPDSFSSALVGWASGSRRRVGYRRELRSLLLSHAYSKPEGRHRVEEYVHLLERYFGYEATAIRVGLAVKPMAGEGGAAFGSAATKIILNFNSEAQSRRMPVEKAIRIADRLRQATESDLVLIGSPKEVPFVEAIRQGLADRRQVFSAAGQTTLPQLARLIRSADLMLSTDSGPAHLASSQGTRLLVFFGAGDETSTGPFHAEGAEVMRAPGVSCTCRSNTCRYGVPPCLLQLDEDQIVSRALALLGQR